VQAFRPAGGQGLPGAPMGGMGQRPPPVGIGHPQQMQQPPFMRPPPQQPQGPRGGPMQPPGSAPQGAPGRPPAGILSPPPLLPLLRDWKNVTTSCWCYGGVACSLAALNCRKISDELFGGWESSSAAFLTFAILCCQFQRDWRREHTYDDYSPSLEVFICTFLRYLQLSRYLQLHILLAL